MEGVESGPLGLRNWADHRSAIAAIRRLAVIPLVAMIVGGGGGLAYALSRSTPFESRSQVVVSPASGFLDPARVNAFSSITASVAELASSQRVLADALSRLSAAGFPGRTSSWFSGHLRVRVGAGTPILTITGVDQSARTASAVASAETDALVSVIDAASKAAIQAGSTATTRTTKVATTTETVTANGGILLQAFSHAEAQRATTGVTRNLLIGASAGLVLGLFCVSRLLARRARLRSESSSDRTSASTAG